MRVHEFIDVQPLDDGELVPHPRRIIEARGEPILNPITKEPHRAQVNLPGGFEYATAEFGRGWGKTFGPIKLDLKDSHAHFCNLHLTGAGVVH